MGLILLILITLIQWPHFLEAGVLRPLKPDNEPIDIVYTWVDGEDEAWQKARNEALLKSPGRTPAEVATQNRFRDRDELKYSLRSVHQFAPFVNHIYIVTYGQKPKWLKNHPKITIIDHQDIFLNRQNLPTFNSQAIEANLHRIPNLSERFIYFNDDFLLGRSVTSEDFYTLDGKIKFLFSKWATPTGSTEPNDNGFDAAWKRTNRFLDNHYSQSKRYAIKHSPYAMRKSLINQLEQAFSPLFKKISGHQFRSFGDYVLLNGLVQYIAKYENQAKIGTLANMTLRFGDDALHNRKQLEKIKKNRPHTFCIQDVVKKNTNRLDKQLARFFVEYFPEKAPWEE